MSSIYSTEQFNHLHFEIEKVSRSVTYKTHRFQWIHIFTQNMYAYEVHYQKISYCFKIFLISIVYNKNQIPLSKIRN